MPASQPSVDHDENHANLEAKQARSRFSTNCFTVEKANHLRMLTSGMSSHNDAMYLFVIASSSF
ncbi:unnamed protein product [Linum tenue]|uniref:Uncharacterized protein n=1 Tax=Linum tenue TaxID=586396 RepID=A0AAV0JA06_9ROSI|nr:unnamed protein product [Linum tenue]